jgi:hypothetical protein
MSAVGDVAHGSNTRVHHVAQPEEAQVRVLHVPMVLGVALNLDRRLVVHDLEQGRVKRVAELAEEQVYLHDLLACRNGRDVRCDIQETEPVPRCS